MAEKFIVKGGKRLRGEVKISGYKNSAGAILAATLLSKKPSIVDNLPLISDIVNQVEIMKRIGVKIKWLNKNKIMIDPKNLNPENLPVDLFEKTRISVLLIPPLLLRFKKIILPHPGGDKIGLRPITTHLEAFEDFGIKVKEEGGYYHFEMPKKLEGKRIILKEFSVTATENVMMLASLARGKTTIELAACEPQVQDLGYLLKRMGVKIKGIGNHTLEIEGKKELKGAQFKVCPDPIETVTFFVAFAITGGEGKIKPIVPTHLTAFLRKMREINVIFEIKKDEILVKKSTHLRATKIQSLPFPGFLTDFQPMTATLLTQAKGKSLIHEPLYEGRFSYLLELKKMGADIEITDPHRALIFGKTKLQGNKINGTDIRAGASLVLAALSAQGTSEVSGVQQIERGYENFEEKLRKLGAKIEKV